MSRAAMLFYLDPEEYVIELDSQHPYWGQPDHPGYDRRMLRPLRDLEHMVQDMVQNGFAGTALAVRSYQDRLVVEDGRERVRAAREANRRLRDLRHDPIQLPHLPAEPWGDGSLMRGTRLNTMRLVDSPIEMAERARQLNQSGHSEVDILQALRLTDRDHLVSLLRLLDLCPAAQDAIRAGRLGMKAGVALTAMTSGEQERFLAAQHPSRRLSAREIRTAARGRPLLTQRDLRRFTVGAKSFQQAPDPLRALARLFLNEATRADLALLAEWVQLPPSLLPKK